MGPPEYTSWPDRPIRVWHAIGIAGIVVIVGLTAMCATSAAAYRSGYARAVQDVMSGKVKPHAAATQWVVDGDAYFGTAK